jgi:hypothetical protein
MVAYIIYQINENNKKIDALKPDHLRDIFFQSVLGMRYTTKIIND